MMRLIPVILLLLASCSSTKQAASPPAMRTKANPSSSCLIKGRIISIIPQGGADTTDICNRYPCQATVAITEVLGCGSDVSQKLVETDIITIRFAFTLASTKQVFPDKNLDYPGLKSGDAFTAYVEQRQTLSSRPGFVVYDYEVMQ